MNTLSIIRSSFSRKWRVIASGLFLIISGDTTCIQEMNADYGEQIILVSNSQGMNNGPSGLEKSNAPETQSFTEEQRLIVDGVKADILNYLTSDEYKLRTINEYKFAKISSSQLDINNLVQSISNVELNSDDYHALDEMIDERTRRLAFASDNIVFVYQFYTPYMDADKIVYYPEPPGLEHLGMMREANGKTQTEMGYVTSLGGELRYTEPGKVYILDLLSHPGIYGDVDAQKAIVMNTLFHEWGGHALTNGNLGITPGARAVFNKYKSIYLNKSNEAPDESEQQAMLMSIRYRMKQKNIISSVQQSIGEKEMNFLKQSVDFDVLKQKINQLLSQDGDIEFVNLLSLNEMICLDIMFIEDIFHLRMSNYYDLINSLTTIDLGTRNELLSLRTSISAIG